MDIVRHALVLLHLGGFAALFGGAFVQAREQGKVVNAAMVHGALTQVVTGLLLVGVREGQDLEVDQVKIGVKLAVTLVITVLVWMNRRKRSIPTGLFGAVLLLTLANAAIAVFWT